MAVTDTLQKKFTENRKRDTSGKKTRDDRLKFLEALGIDPDFKKACYEMFQEVGADVGELMGVRGLIIDEDKSIQSTITSTRKRKYAGM